MGEDVIASVQDEPVAGQRSARRTGDEAGQRVDGDTRHQNATERVAFPYRRADGNDRRFLPLEPYRPAPVFFSVLPCFGEAGREQRCRRDRGVR